MKMIFQDIYNNFNMTQISVAFIMTKSQVFLIFLWGFFLPVFITEVNAKDQLELIKIKM